MFDLYVYFMDIADAFAVTGGAINRCIALFFYALSFAYGAFMFLLPFNVAFIAWKLRW